MVLGSGVSTKTSNTSRIDYTRLALQTGDFYRVLRRGIDQKFTIAKESPPESYTSSLVLQHCNLIIFVSH
jgi:hypothetical protein